MFSANDYEERARRAIEAAEGLDALVLTRAASINYIAGFEHMPTERPIYAILVKEGEPILLVPRLEFDHAKKRSWIKSIRLWYTDLPVVGSPLRLLDKIIQQIGLDGKRIGIEDSSLIDKLKMIVPTIEWLPAEDIVPNLRMVKSAKEIEVMKLGCRYADFAMNFLRESATEGISELELGIKAVSRTYDEILREVQRVEAGHRPLIWTQVRFGSNAAFPHGFSSKRKLKRGDCIVFMALSSLFGYSILKARTAFFGKPTPEQLTLYRTVHDAQNVGLGTIKPGTRGCDVHGAVSGVLRRAGCDEYIPGRTGFGIGLEAHERPYLAEADETILQVGMTICIGSSICIPDQGGYRIFDAVVVTERGCEPLTEYPTNLEQFVIER